MTQQDTITTTVVVVAVATWEDAFREWLLERGKADNTARAYISDVRQFASYFSDVTGQEFAPELLTKRLVRAWWRVQDGAASSRNRRLASLTVLVQYCHDTGLLDIDDNPINGLRRIRQVDPPPRSREREYDALVNVARAGGHAKNTPKHRLLAVRDRVAFGLMGAAGLRVSEVASLRIDDVMFERGEIRVDGKGGIEGRVIVPQVLLDDIRAWLDVRPVGDNNRLLTDWKGDPITAGTIRRRIKAIGHAAGVPGLTPHDLRHTYIYRLLDVFLRGDTSMPVALDAVRRQARHRDTRTTQSYLRARYDQVRGAVDEL